MSLTRAQSHSQGTLHFLLNKVHNVPGKCLLITKQNRKKINVYYDFDFLQSKILN